jgi:hypothetical protein
MRKAAQRRTPVQFYELATLTLNVGATPKAAPAIAAYLGDSGRRGTLLGCWFSDLGNLNQVAVLRGFASREDLAAERNGALTSSSPFNCGEFLSAIMLDSYAPFPDMPPVATGRHGPVYEIRSYILKPGGLTPTLAAWAEAVPERTKYSKLVAAMYALDGAPRITHIWPYPSLNDRARIRGEAVARGIWPPKNGPAWLTPAMQATIYLPFDFSPLQ